MSNKSNEAAIAVLLVILGVTIPFAVGAIGRHNAKLHKHADAGLQDASAPSAAPVKPLWSAPIKER